MTHVHRREFSELPITIDRAADSPLPAQIVSALREAIDRDALRPGEAVPATRELAGRLRVARGVVVAAYEQLITEGYLVAGHGRPTRVHPELRSVEPAPVGNAPLNSRTSPQSASATPRPAGQTMLSEPTPGPLTPGLPDTSTVATAAWRAAWRQAATRAHLEAPDLGDPGLRTEIAEHLRRMRGTIRPASDITVTAGAREGLGLLLTALGTTRGRSLTLGVEEPGYPSLRRVATRHGANIVALPVDREGLVTERLPTGVLDAVLVTPSHQYPLGGSLPLSRRRQLLDWSRRTGAVVIEDDYDSELRHSGGPLPTLAALDDPRAGSVVLLGTFSKTVSQALSAGYLLAPDTLRPAIEAARHDLGGPVSAVVQAALADYLRGGELRRHTARMRRRYAARRELVVERLYGVPGVRVRPMSGGLHAVVEFSPESGLTEHAVLARCNDLGAVPLSAYWHGETSPTGRAGLIIGTGGSLDEATFESALVTLRQALITGRSVASSQ
jgi:GntR family transcriptional regulator/MocR family aminotransferase